mgnify:CR=1 FL=1
MDTIWYENPSKSEVIGPCGGDKKKTERPRRTDKTRTLKKLNGETLNSLETIAYNIYTSGEFFIHISTL